jgi:hypothetical protein
MTHAEQRVFLGKVREMIEASGERIEQMACKRLAEIEARIENHGRRISALLAKEHPRLKPRTQTCGNVVYLQGVRPSAALDSGGGS